MKKYQFYVLAFIINKRRVALINMISQRTACSLFLYDLESKEETNCLLIEYIFLIHLIQQLSI